MPLNLRFSKVLGYISPRIFGRNADCSESMSPRAPRLNSSGMSHDSRKRIYPGFQSSADSAAVASSMSSAFSRHTHSHTLPQGSTYPPPRSDSPPASAYFPSLSADTNTRLRPIPDAESHFAYSTTLRRHQSEGPISPSELAQVVEAEASSIWQRFTGQHPSPSSDYQPLESAPKQELRHTVSARFAHCSVEVRSRKQRAY